MVTPTIRLFYCYFITSFASVVNHNVNIFLAVEVWQRVTTYRLRTFDLEGKGRLSDAPGESVNLLHRAFQLDTAFEVLNQIHELSKAMQYFCCMCVTPFCFPPCTPVGQQQVLLC